MAEKDEHLYFAMLQKKVEKHIAMKRIGLLENKYMIAQEEKHEKGNKLVNNVIWGSPMQRYLELFAKCEKPSEKVKRAEASSCDSILKQIQHVKTSKHI